MNSVLHEKGYFMVLQSIETKDKDSNKDPTHLRFFSLHSLLYLFNNFDLIKKKQFHVFAWILPNWLGSLLISSLEDQY